MSLDTALLSLLGESDIEEDDVEAKLDEVLSSSLFNRRMLRQSESNQVALRAGLIGRAKYIWSETTSLQRRGYFLAGVGLATGKELDVNADALGLHLLHANIAIESREFEIALQSIVSFAEIAFSITPFTPNKLLDDWRAILRNWLSGGSLHGAGDDTIQFIEQAFVFNLPWAMEAVRVRAEVYADPFSETLSLSDYTRAYPVAALETGTLSIPAAILIQAGFGSRRGAITAVSDVETDFNSVEGLKGWLTSPDVVARTQDPLWPTPESHELWLEFVNPTKNIVIRPWTEKSYQVNVDWIGAPPPPGSALSFGKHAGNPRAVFTASHVEVGQLRWTPNSSALGLIIATSTGSPDKLKFEYVGPDDILG